MPNTYTQLYVHIVFTVKGRQNLIPKTKKETLHKYITGIVQNRKHKMPFLMNCNKAIEIMVRDIDRRKVFSGMPWQTYFFIRFIAKLPRSLYVGLVKALKFKL